MILNIILKNLKIILRSPSTILILILAPMILMFLIGLAYNNGDNLTNANVGVFGNVEGFFNTEKVNFIEYDEENLEYSNRLCQEDLKRGNLQLCIYLETQKDIDGNLLTAKVVYILDNSDTTMGNILINFFEYEIRGITKEISSNTITGILSEVDSTLQFVNETRELVYEVDSSLDLLDKRIQTNDAEIKATILSLKVLIPNLISTSNFLIENLEQLEELEGRNLNIVEDDFDQVSESLEKIIDEVDEIRDSVESNFGYVPSDVEDYLDSIEGRANYILSEIEDLKDETLYLQENINELDISNSITQLENLVENLEEIEPQIEQLDEKYDLLKTSISDAQEKTQDVKNQIDEKFSYFEELSKQDSGRIVSPISTETHRVFDKFTRIHELAPTIIVVIMLFIGLLLSNVIVSIEVQSKAYFRNLISPVSQLHFVIALFFTSLIIIFFQLIFFFVILQFVFNISAFYFLVKEGGYAVIVFWDVLFVALHVLTVFILLGMFLALWFSSMQISILVTTFVMLFFFLLSDIILPLQLMPEFFYNLISYNPVVIAQDMFRQIFFFWSLYEISFSKLVPFYYYIIILIGLILIAVNRKKSQIL